MTSSDFHPDAHPEATEITGDANYGQWGQCIATNRNDERCGGHAKGEHGKCHSHGGSTPTKEENDDVGNGDQQNNGNAATHNLYSDRDKLYQRLPDEEKEHVNQLAASYYDRYEEVYGEEPDYAATQRLKNVAMDVHKETLADNYAAEHSDDDTHPLIEEQVIGVKDDTGEPIRVKRPNQLIGVADSLKSGTRMWLKDMGLLNSPEDKQAENMGTIADILSEAAEAD